MTTLIVGCGYLGTRVALQLLHRDAHAPVFGTTRSLVKADRLANAGIRPILADVTDPASVAKLPVADRVFFAVGYDRTGGASREAVGVLGLRSVIAHLRNSQPPGRFVLASTTGVYGQTDGSWVDESSPTEPTEDSGRIALEAEGALGPMNSTTILRFAGLYGPGRIIGRGGLERGEAVRGDPDRWLNLIHVEDAARVVVEALFAEDLAPVYTVADDRPLRRRDYYETAARFLGAPLPRFLSDSSGSSNKRVRNAGIKKDLRTSLRFPDVGSGLPASLIGPG